MPELPEVTTVSRRLDSLIAGRRVVSVDVVTPKLVKGVSPQILANRLEGLVFKRVYNIGKFMVWEFEDTPLLLLSHMRMDGRYHLATRPEPDSYIANTRLIFELEDGGRLTYIDTRGFGTFELREGESELLATPPISLLAKTPDAISPPEFLARLARSKRPIKTLLLDQQCILGLGNIYADETLFAAKFLPNRPASSLSRGEVLAILGEAARILKEACELGGSSVHSFYVLNEEIGGYQGRLKVYARNNKPCLTCGKLIKKIRLGGRGTHLCLTCQR